MASNNVPKSGDTIIVLVGSGEGKNTIANSYIGNIRFSSGSSYDGERITKQCSIHRVNDDILICDTPRTLHAKNISDEIMDVFNHKDVTYKIFFVIDVLSGRIDSSDIREMMKVDFEFSVIINKLSEREMNNDYRESLKRANKGTFDILCLRKEIDAESVDNAMLESGDSIREFINRQKSYSIVI